MKSQYGQMEKIIFFVYLVRLGSISAAAEHAEISIATGSRWVAELEQQYQVKLLHRKGNSVALTNQGSQFFERWRYIVDDIIKINQEIKMELAEKQGNIKICCTPVYAQQFLLPVIAKYSAINPKVRFNVEINPHGLAEASKYDIIFSAVSSYDSRIEKNLNKIKKVLIQQPFITIASPSYLRVNGEPNSPYELPNHLCLYARSLTLKKEWAYVIQDQQQAIAITDVMEVSDSNLLLQAAQLGLGIAYLPLFVAKHALERGEVKTILTDYPTAQWQLGIYYDPLSEIDALAQSFKEFYLSEINQAANEHSGLN